MKHIDQEIKKTIEPGIRNVLQKYDMRATISIKDEDTLLINLRSGCLDIIANAQQNVYLENINSKSERKHKVPRKYLTINQLWYHKHFDGTVRKFFDELFDSAKGSVKWYEEELSEEEVIGELPYKIKVVAGEPTKPYKIYRT